MNSHRSVKLSFAFTIESVLAGFAAGLIILGIGWLVLFLNQYNNKFYPGIEIDGVSVAGLTREQARNKLLSSTLPEEQISLSVDDITISSSSAQLGIHHNVDPAIEQAFRQGRNKNFINNLIDITRLQFQPRAYQTSFDLNLDKITQMIEELASLVDQTGEKPSAILYYPNSPDSIEIFAGKIGRKIEQEKTAQLFIQNNQIQNDIPAIVASTSAQLNEDQIDQAYERAKNFVGQEITFTKDYTKVKLSDQDLISILAFPTGINEESLQEIFDNWQEVIDRPARDAQFEYDPKTLEVTTFVPHQTGLELDEEKTLDQIRQTVKDIDTQSETIADQQELVTKDSLPEKTLASTNDLGIDQIIGFGESYYYHSIPSRINNVKITTDRISNTIVAPGEEFSFNKTLGDVSAATGYQPAYVIKDGMTVLGDGGGVCQVSSTMFRALLDAGLDITRRLPHSYRVSYYELNSDPGFDATVYSGNVDLRFINDTDHHILIHGQANSQDLYMKIEIYGTDDGRQSETFNYRKWGYLPPAETQYFDDPSLPNGTLKQIDWAASGIKAEFDWKVTDKNGKVLHEQTFYSNYRPWSAKYLRGTGQ